MATALLRQMTNSLFPRVSRKAPKVMQCYYVKALADLLKERQNNCTRFDGTVRLASSYYCRGRSAYREVRVWALSWYKTWRTYVPDYQYAGNSGSSYSPEHSEDLTEKKRGYFRLFLLATHMCRRNWLESCITRAESTKSVIFALVAFATAYLVNCTPRKYVRWFRVRYRTSSPLLRESRCLWPGDSKRWRQSRPITKSPN